MLTASTLSESLRAAQGVVPDGCKTQFPDYFKYLLFTSVKTTPVEHLFDRLKEQLQSNILFPWLCNVALVWVT